MADYICERHCRLGHPGRTVRVGPAVLSTYGGGPQQQHLCRLDIQASKQYIIAASSTPCGLAFPCYTLLFAASYVSAAAATKQDDAAVIASTAAVNWLNGCKSARGCAIRNRQEGTLTVTGKADSAVGREALPR